MPAALTPDAEKTEARQVKAVFFDVEGTLWDSAGCTHHALNVVLPNFVGQLPTDDLDELTRCFNAVLFDQFGREHLRETRPISGRRRFQALLDAYQVRDRGLAQKMSSRFDRARRLVMRQFVRRDAFQLLGELAERGIVRGAIVNGIPAAERHLVQSLGLDSHLDHLVLAQVEGFQKPDVRIFRRALEIAGCAPQEALYVGDSPLTDVLGASRAGMPTVWFNEGRRVLPRGFPPPDFTISRLRELLSIVDM